MSMNLSFCKAQWLKGALLTLAATAWSCLAAGSASAGTSTDYYRIEEDWQIVLGTPNSASSTPQISMEMAPDPNAALAGVFLINYGDTPDFVAGGAQAQLWNQDTNLALADFRSNAFSTAGDTITFTLYMERSNGQLKFGVVKGNCASWGLVGNSKMNLTYPDNTPNFPSYQSSYSVNHATIVVGASRVQSMTLLQVRKYKANKNNYDTEPSQNVFP
jgi:hypothetical protein